MNLPRFDRLAGFSDLNAGKLAVNTVVGDLWSLTTGNRPAATFRVDGQQCATMPRGQEGMLNG